MFTCENVALSRGDKQLFSGVGVTLFSGACLVIRGANGSGKTSLLRVLAGVDSPDEGAIIWDGELASQSNDFSRECQAVWHKNAMKSHLTVEENLLFWARLHGCEMLMPVATHLWQLQEVLDQPYHHLSQGWQRRVALARLILSDSKLWIMDEPVANLDAAGIDMLERLIHSRCSQGGIVVLSSHIEVDLPDAIQMHIEDFK